MRLRAPLQGLNGIPSSRSLVDGSRAELCNGAKLIAGLLARRRHPRRGHHRRLADRLAEATAEWLHRHARIEWGYESKSDFAAEDLLSERFRGIRPAFGYPACPDHSQKQLHFDLLECADIGCALTDHMAMTPAASISGFYFGHPDSKYFGVGRLDRDQVEDYAERAGLSLAEAEKWLAPWLAYDV